MSQFQLRALIREKVKSDHAKNLDLLVLSESLILHEGETCNEKTLHFKAQRHLGRRPIIFEAVVVWLWLCLRHI